MEIPLLPVIAQSGDVKDSLDARDAIPKIQAALNTLNVLNDTKIRIVILGTGCAHFLFEAITYVLKEWHHNYPKQVQFFTSGDTGNSDFSKFCQWLCISKVCETIEFINTMDYHPFGFCATAYNSR